MIKILQRLDRNPSPTHPPTHHHSHKWGEFYLRNVAFPPHRSLANSHQIIIRSYELIKHWIRLIEFNQQMMSYSTDLAHWAWSTQEQRMGCILMRRDKRGGRQCLACARFQIGIRMNERRKMCGAKEWKRTQNKQNANNEQQRCNIALITFKN